MALFNPNGPDANIHWFTQFLQAEGREEMEEVIRRCDEAASAKGFQGATLTPEMLNVVMFFQDMSQSFILAHLRDGLVNTAKTRLLATTIGSFMHPVAKSYVSWGSVYPGDEFSRLKPLSEMPDSTMLPARSVVWDTPDLEVAETALLKIAVDSTWWFINEMLPMGLCEECSRPFVEVKRGQKYCSHRCRARLSERKRYAERMEGYPRRHQRAPSK